MDEAVGQDVDADAVTTLKIKLSSLVMVSMHKQETLHSVLSMSSIWSLRI